LSSSRQVPPLSESGSTGHGAGRWRSVAAVLIPVALLLAVGYFWNASRVPSTYSVMDMGYVDLGGGPGSTDMAHMDMSHSGVSLATLTGPRKGNPDVDVTLTARHQDFALASGEKVNGYTLNGRSPGPEIDATQGDLVQVTLRNENVPGGVTLHWHGVDVPNAEDGVAGVTQNAVPVGGTFVYRFVVPDAGTYWYHSHQVSHDQVKGGMFGTFIVAPEGSLGATAKPSADFVAPVHNYSGYRTIAGRTGTQRLPVGPGAQARIRVINTDNGPLQTWVTGASFKVLAIDGHDVNRPTAVSNRLLVVPAGGRADLAITAPPGGAAARFDAGGGTSVLIGPKTGTAPVSPAPSRRLDMLAYGSPAALPFDPAKPDRRFDYRIGRRIGFEDGKPGYWWSINGHLFPDIPMFMVSEGDVVTMTIANNSGDVHPMHLHGHHAVVLSRNGVKATGSPWWIDSLEVEDNQTFVIAFVADNPGIWMDHCHNLDHAVNGLIAHLAYTGVTEPYVVGHPVGDGGHNQPE
jgi:FtsP/CotA-like multicopper oxidase with cupredoxin domain